MLGVILWKDEARNKAVVWCEDHANLAFISDLPDFDGAKPVMSVGDLISFDLMVRGNTRYADNPKLVMENQFPDLSDRLSDTVVQLRNRDTICPTETVRPMRRGAA